MTVTSVAVVGANGTLGTEIISALVSAKAFQVTILKRNSSSSTSPYSESEVRIVDVDDGFTVDNLTKVLRHHDALVIAFPLRDFDAHLRLVEAAAAAGVKHVIPADYGSVDAENPEAQRLVALYRRKIAVRRLADKLSAKNPDFTWTGIVCGHFFEWGLKEHLFHADLKQHTIDILDGGIHRASATTLTRVAEAVVRILKLHGSEAVRNKNLFIQSFCVSQTELVQSLEKATKTQWTVRDYDSTKFIEERREKADAGDFMAIEDIVFAIGTLYADWTNHENLAMDLLGFKDEDLDSVVQGVVASL
ncbi:hypothetical protein HJFPF1_10511 [Paramyrothecium foliicola]|nr:hypothetical protein HJFPF1_10511 [Paramyrothecium foliicola]